MEFFTMLNLNIYSFRKNFLRTTSELVHMVRMELLKLSDGLVN